MTVKGMRQNKITVVDGEQERRGRHIFLKVSSCSDPTGQRTKKDTLRREGEEKMEKWEEY